MSIETELSLNSKPFEEKLAESETQVNNVANKMNKSLASVGSKKTEKNQTKEKLDDIGDSADKAITALDSVSGAFGGVSTGLSGIAGDIVNLVINPLSGAIAAVGALVAAGVTVWQKLTLSAEEYAEKTRFAADQAKSKLDDVFKGVEADSGYFERLQELNRLENLSNEEKEEAIALVETLSKKYNGLGLSIDSATGKIKGLDEAQNEFLRQQLKLKVSAAKTNMTAQKYVADSATEGAFGIRNVNAWLSPSAFGDPTKSANVMRAQQWNQGGLEGKLAAVRSALSDSKDSEEIKIYQNLIVEIEKLILAEKEYENVKKFGERTEKEYLEYMKKRSEEAKKRRENESKEFYSNTNKNLDYEIQLETLKLQGKDDEIEKQKIINQLKEKGLKVDEAEINKILEKQKELGKIKFNQEVLNGLNDLEYQAEKKFGNARKADLDKQKKEYEKQKGSKLTKEEEERIEKLFNLQTKLNSFPQLNLQGLDIQTNSLTSRGGFKTGAVESNTDRINTQIMNYSKAQTDLLNQIKTEISKLKKI